MGSPRKRCSDCTYLVGAFGDELMMQRPLNVHRFVVVFRVPAIDALDAAGLLPRLDRWRIERQHAGWRIGWRDAVAQDNPAQRYVETYCYAFAEPGFLDDDMQQLYWRTDIVHGAVLHARDAALRGDAVAKGGGLHPVI